MQQAAAIQAPHQEFDVKAEDLDHEVWLSCAPAAIDHYWSGAPAPSGRHAEARLLWTELALCVRFECRQAEPIIVSDNPQTGVKTLGLWNRDVCEIFLAPDKNELNRYFEFEAAPTGEWVDLAIRNVGNRRETEWEFRSNMTTQAALEPGILKIAMRIPWFDQIPRPCKGDEWRLNLCRCVGEDPDRGYLAWRPTHTAEPNFHVPTAFGTIVFT
ncbi:MAG TPA: carbohydrate-binding family 9-like protein [Pyrinomonadaceae bacterium]|nr:carbohydrate-binding family 9-like protein [Pyrinomonadaceae bacterium]